MARFFHGVNLANRILMIKPVMNIRAASVPNLAMDSEYTTQYRGSTPSTPSPLCTRVVSRVMGVPMMVVPALRIRYPIMVLTVPITMSLTLFLKNINPIHAMIPSMTVGLPSTLVIKSIAKSIVSPSPSSPTVSRQPWASVWPRSLHPVLWSVL